MKPGFVAADWRDAEAYVNIATCGRAGLAWEVLRRNPAYRSAHSVSTATDDGFAAQWGLHFP